MAPCAACSFAKKGDLSICKKWRGICLLDVRSKLLSSILVRRLQIVMEEFDMDSQTGFRPDCSTIDGIFTTFVGHHKRKEHGLETWALFIELAKAFDTVPREALFAILRRFGLPDHFVNIVICLHENALINVKKWRVLLAFGSVIVRARSCSCSSCRLQWRP